MPGPDALMREVRERVGRILELCVDALTAGVEIQRVQGYYVRRADELLTDAETHAVLARESSDIALGVIQDCAAHLAALSGELAAEIRQAAGGDE